LAPNGRAYCWGSNRLGQLGDDRTASVAANVRNAVAVATSETFTSISAGANHTCAVTRAGEAYCWGLNFTGELAQALVANECGGFPCSRRPVRVETAVRFDTVSAGFGHTCALSGGRAFCWGRNDRGQLGTPPADDQCEGVACNVTPVRVTGVSGFTSISAGGDHTCGMAGEVAYCWGSNQYGQLGASASVLRSSRPLRVVTEEPLLAIEARGIRTCGRTEAGREICWGIGAVTAP
jgi:serine/threonine-protein kinase